MCKSRLNYVNLWNVYSAKAAATIVFFSIATDTRPDDTSIRVAFAVGALGLYAVLDLYVNCTWRQSAPRTTNWRIQALVAIFLVIATASALWAGDPMRTLRAVAVAWEIFLSWLVVKYWALRQPIPKIKTLLRLICIAIIALAGLLSLELSTNQLIHQFLVNSLGMSMSIPNFYVIGEHHIYVSPQFLSQHVGTLSYLFWPVVLGLSITIQRGRKSLIALFVALTLISVSISINETAMLAMTIGIGAFLVASILPRTAVTLVGAIAVMATMAIVPLTYISHDMLQLWNNPYIPPSGQGRIHIWNQIAHAIVRSTPQEMLRGHGVVHLQALLYNGTGFIWEHALAYNVFLQTWYEVGLLGAVVLLVIVLVILGDIRRLPRYAMCCALGAFVVVIMSLVTTAWELWVPWHLGLIGLVAVVSTLLNQVLVRGWSSTKSGIDGKAQSAQYLSL